MRQSKHQLDLIPIPRWVVELQNIYSVYVNFFNPKEPINSCFLKVLWGDLELEGIINFIEFANYFIKKKDET